MVAARQQDNVWRQVIAVFIRDARREYRNGAYFQAGVEYKRANMYAMYVAQEHGDTLDQLIRIYQLFTRWELRRQFGS